MKNIYNLNNIIIMTMITLEEKFTHSSMTMTRV